MSRGFVILAQDVDGESTYQQCAEALRLSIVKSMPWAKVSLITDNDNIITNQWDKVILLPYGDLAKESNWKLINDFQVYEASPYEHTIKLEADLFVPQSIDFWWDILSSRDIVVCSTIRDIYGNKSSGRFYRRFIDENKLPDCYNAITYFNKSTNAEKFFTLVREVFENWNDFKSILKCNSDELATTDWVYAIVCHLMGVENTILPTFDHMSMVHMKHMIINSPTEKWTDSFIYEFTSDQFRIQTQAQLYPVHYYVKEFSRQIIEYYGK